MNADLDLKIDILLNYKKQSGGLSAADPSNASVLQINMCQADSVALHDPERAKKKKRANEKRYWRAIASRDTFICANMKNE